MTMMTAIRDTKLYQDEFLTGLGVLPNWLPSTASSSSAPPRPAPAGSLVNETAELAEIVKNMSKTVASLAKRKDSTRGGGADPKRARNDKGKDKNSESGNGDSAGQKQHQQERFNVYMRVSRQMGPRSASSSKRTLAATAHARLYTGARPV